MVRLLAGCYYNAWLPGPIGGLIAAGLGCQGLCAKTVDATTYQAHLALTPACYNHDKIFIKQLAVPSPRAETQDEQTLADTRADEAERGSMLMEGGVRQ